MPHHETMISTRHIVALAEDLLSAIENQLSVMCRPHYLGVSHAMDSKKGEGLLFCGLFSKHRAQLKI
jgi:hypothetical protein